MRTGSEYAHGTRIPAERWVCDSWIRNIWARMLSTFGHQFRKTTLDLFCLNSGLGCDALCFFANLMANGRSCFAGFVEALLCNLFARGSHSFHFFPGFLRTLLSNLGERLARFLYNRGSLLFPFLCNILALFDAL